MKRILPLTGLLYLDRRLTSANLIVLTVAMLFSARAQDGPGYFSPDRLLPTPNTVYISPAQQFASSTNGVILRDAQLRDYSQHFAPPALGVTATNSFSATLDVQVSLNNGATYQLASGSATVQMRITHSSDAADTSVFNTELLQLDVPLGSGLMLRESPTLQSTGQTTIRSVPGGYLISSYFDVNTEISTNGGTSWTPAQGAGHIELRNDPSTVTPVPEPTQLLPPPNGWFTSPQLWFAFTDGGIVLRDPRFKEFTSSFAPPSAGATNTYNFNLQVDIQESVDGGSTMYQYVRVPFPPMQMVVSGAGSSSSGWYDAEITSFSMNLPNGVMIRESPTLPSRGPIQITPQPDGTYSIASFFDIFTELSVDGGATWSAAANGAARMQLVPIAPEAPKPNPNLPPLDGTYLASIPQWFANYANGIIITNATVDRFTQTQPPPPPGGSQTENFGCRMTGLISLNGGASFAPFAAPANVVWQVNSRSDLDTGSTRFFDTEWLSFSVSGGTLPGGLMVRESPSKASLGRTSIRTGSGGDYRISSFFDVFTEVSLDGGVTWSPNVRHPGTLSLNPPPTNAPPLLITCSSNITVTASSGAGAVVNYTVNTSGGCPPLNVVANPPSGSTFPIGTTTVSATASDTCGNSTNCTFDVTVLPFEYFFPQALFPSIGSVYLSPNQWFALFNNGIVIRNVRHRFFTQHLPFPPLGATQTDSFGSELDFELSTDNGHSFTPATGTVNVTIRVTHTSDSGNTMFFDTELLQLDLNGPGLLLRESPNLQSIGQTTVRPVAAGFLISDSLDAFTEVSIDGGNSWIPAQQSGRLEMHPDPSQVSPVSMPTALFPPPGGEYVSAQTWFALYAPGVVVRNNQHKFFTTAFLPPAAGMTHVLNFNSLMDLQFSTDGGATYQYARVAAPLQMTVASHASGADTIYDIELTTLPLSLPEGLMIRESPTLPSRGQLQVDPQPDGTFRITSLLDIFTELSLDGGATWYAATNGPGRMQLMPIAPEVAEQNPNLPPMDGLYTCPAQWWALYANGIIITNSSIDHFTQTAPPPPPGGNQTDNFGCRIIGLISMDGGASFAPFAAPANATWQVNSRSDLDTSTTRFFDTEWLSFSVSGGTLPGGVMVRESPSKASLGRTSIRTANGADFRISSFFDVFTEVSLDGGASWSPDITLPGTLVLTTNQTAGCNPPPAGLVAWWRGENSTLDAVASHNGTLMNSAAFTAGEVGAAFSLDGVDDYISVPHDAAFNFSSSITIEAWLKTSSSPNSYIITKGEDSFFLALGGGLANNKLSFYLYGPSGDWLRSTNELNDNQWHHVAGTYDGATLKVYVDGALQNSVAGSGNVLSGTSPVSIGARGSANTFAGALDELSLYNRALSAAEIQAIYAARSAGKCVQSVLPTLTSTRSGNSILISWPSPSSAFVLQQNADLQNAAGWADFTGTVSDDGTTKSVSISLPATNTYYRLKK